MSEQYEDYARVAADAADSKKAKDVVILDIQELSAIADYFIICSAKSRTQVQAIADEVRDKLEERGLTCKGMEGKDDAKWILVDFGDVVAHVFMEEEREFFGLERLWGDAPRLPVSV